MFQQAAIPYVFVLVLPALRHHGYLRYAGSLREGLSIPGRVSGELKAELSISMCVCARACVRLSRHSLSLCVKVCVFGRLWGKLADVKKPLTET